MTLADGVAGSILVALNAYVLLGGADFGGGVWDLLASGPPPRRAQQRALIAHAIGPVWEANHVWLILAVVLLFTCFPPAFARLAVALHVPLTLVLIGIVLRGSAFTFRSYGGEQEQEQHWGRVFAVASLVTPVLLGVVVGTIASGSVRIPSTGFFSGYIAPWLTPFAFAVGLFALACFAFLAAVYLTLETAERELQEDFRRRAMAAGVAVLVTGALGLVLAPPVRLVGADTVTGTGLAAATALAALWRRRYRVARIAAAAQVSLILWGWGLGQYPYLLPPDLTIAAAAAPDITLELVLGALGLGAVVLFPSLYYLFRVFKGKSGTSRRPFPL